MLIFKEIKPFQQWLGNQRKNEKSIGFVPTMGALHEGHLSLIRKAQEENDLVVCSVYVNPTQFNNAEDLAKYPRLLEKDSLLLEEIACDVLFAPTDTEMYPQKPSIQFDFGSLEKVMEGAYRAGHFNGVGIIVSKLFHIVSPDKAYFGQKDLQQFLIIKKLVEDLFFNVNLVLCPIAREESGLAMSSRNQRLNEEQKQLASHLFKALQIVQEHLKLHKNPSLAEQAGKKYIADFQNITLEYLEITKADSLQKLSEVKTTTEEVALCIAAIIGGVRLIDNILCDF